MHQGIGSVRSGQQYKFGSDRLDASFADEMGAIRRDAILGGRSVETRSSVGESIECDPFLHILGERGFLLSSYE